MPSSAVRQSWLGLGARPPVGAIIERSHPLAHGLVWLSSYAEAGGTPQESVRGRAQTGGTWASTPGGWGLLNGTTTNALTLDLAFTSGPFSVAALVFLSAAPPNGQYPVLFQRQLYTNESSNSGWSLQLRPADDARPGWSFTLLANNSAANYVMSSTTPTVAAGLFLVVGTFDGAASRLLYVNGLLRTSRATSTGVGSTSAAAQVGVSTAGCNPSALLTAAWTRVLSADEVLQLYGNPLCLYRAGRRSWLLPRVQGPTLAAATLTPAGTITRTPAHHEAGSSTGAGAIARTSSHGLAGSTTPGGALARLCALARAGSSTLAGAIARTPSHQEAGASTPQGALGRTPLVGLAGALSAGAGTLARTITGAGAAALAASGALARASSTAYAASVAATGALARTLRGTVATATLAATGALTRVVQVARAATLDLAGVFAGGALHRLYTLLLDASLDLAGALTKGPRRSVAGTLASGGTLARTAALARAGTIPLRGRYVGIFRVVRRASVALLARVALLVAPLRAPSTALLTRTQALAGVAPARPATVRSPARARTLTLSPHRTVPMQLVADDPDAPLVIAPLERNIAFTADFSADIPSGRQIASVATQVVRLDDPTQTDLADDFVATSTRTSGNTGVEVIVGNGAQQERATYRVRIIATLDNSPATDLVGYFDLPCRE